MFQTIKARLLVVILLPLCLLAFTGISSFIVDKGITSEMAAIESMAELASFTSAVIHETQKERGFTAGFVNSGGKLFATELPVQRKVTDAKIEDLQGFLDHFDLEHHSDGVTVPFGKGMAQLHGIQNMRRTISSQSIEPVKAAVYYTNMHREFITSIAAMSHESQDAVLAQSLNSFAMFLRGKECAGIEQAVLSGALAAHELEANSLKALAEISARQNEYFDIFHGTSTPEENEFFQSVMTQTTARIAEKMVQDTFKAALHDEKPEAFANLAATFTFSGPLGVAALADGNLEQAIASVKAKLDTYGALAGLNQDCVLHVASLRRLVSELPEVLKEHEETGGAGFGSWSQEANAAIEALAVSAHELSIDLTATQWLEASTARLGSLREVEHGLAGALVVSALDIQSQAQSRMLIHGSLGLLSIILVALVGYQIFKSVTGRINFMVDNIQAVDSKRDLTLRINDGTRDELSAIAGSFDTLVGRLQETLSHVGEVTTSMTEGSDQVKSSSQSLAVGATEQSANLQSINSQVESVLEQTKANTKSAQSAAVLAQTSESSSEKGMDQMNHMSAAMDEISASSERISDIIKTIDELAFQTNLLALNANVEAARAGEAGKGFAVVAEEVRSLAQRSAQAASETASVITESTQCAQRGVTIAAQAKIALDEISQSTNQVNIILSGIATASEEQSHAIDNVNTGLAELAEVTQYNAAHSEELAAAADQSSGECQALERLVGQFVLGTRNKPTKPTSPNIVAASKTEALRPINSSHPLVAKSTTKVETASSIRPKAPIAVASDECLAFDDSDFSDELEAF